MDMVQLLYNGGPAALVLGLGLVAVKKDLSYIKARMAESLATHKDCKAEGDREHGCLHDRVTGIQERVATLEGRCERAREREHHAK